MTANELQKKLIQLSPFVLKHSVEDSDLISFHQDYMEWNHTNLGSYTIMEDDQQFTIATQEEELQTPLQIWLEPGISMKKIGLQLTNAYCLYRLTQLPEDVRLSLMSQKPLLNDVKDEL